MLICKSNKGQTLHSAVGGDTHLLRCSLRKHTHRVLVLKTGDGRLELAIVVSWRNCRLVHGDEVDLACAFIVGLG